MQQRELLEDEPEDCGVEMSKRSLRGGTNMGASCEHWDTRAGRYAAAEGERDGQSANNQLLQKANKIELGLTALLLCTYTPNLPTSKPGGNLPLLVLLLTLPLVRTLALSRGTGLMLPPKPTLALLCHVHDDELNKTCSNTVITPFWGCQG